jgi:hypothetical protein
MNEAAKIELTISKTLIVGAKAINSESRVDNLEYTNTNTTNTNTIPTDQRLYMKYPVIYTTVTVIHWAFP